MDSIRIDSSQLLPLDKNKVDVDTSKGSITLFITKPQTDCCIIIKKISNDNNPIILYSEHYPINNSNILIFKCNAMVLEFSNNTWTTLN